MKPYFLRWPTGTWYCMACTAQAPYSGWKTIVLSANTELKDGQ